ncbi:MAG: hypothetical protein GY725_05755 [bacterium]|nr:hypothetical protein [bacterium]
MAGVELDIAGNGIATLLINRPESLNALSSSLLKDIDGAVERIEKEPKIRAAIVTGAGRAFVAGADIEEISGLNRESGLDFTRRGQGVFSHIERLEKPVVAAVNGFALGGGCELAMACHMRLASTKAKFGQPEVKLGILPGFGGTQRLPRLVSRGTATQMILSGAIIDAAEALRIGLVSELLEPDDLLGRCSALLEQILGNGPAALAASLAAIRDGLDESLETSMEVEAKLFSAACGTEEMKEGTRAFLEKRDPKF